MSPAQLSWRDASGWMLNLWRVGNEGRMHLDPPPGGWTVSGYRRLARLIEELQAVADIPFRMVLPADAVRGFHRIARRARMIPYHQAYRDGGLVTHYRWTP